MMKIKSNIKYLLPLLVMAVGCDTPHYNIKDLLVVANVTPDFKYPMVVTSGPVTKFMPSNQADWTKAYFLSHPKELGLGLYLMENAYYKAGDAGVKSFLDEVCDGSYCTDYNERWFDRAVLKGYVSDRMQYDMNLKSGYMAYDLEHPPKDLSLSQELLGGIRGGTRGISYASAINRRLKKFPNNSYILSACGECIGDELWQPTSISGGRGLSLADKKSGYFTVSKERAFYWKAAKADPDNLDAWSGLGDSYYNSVPPDYKEALFCFKKELKAFEKLGANPNGDRVHLLKTVTIPDLEKKTGQS